MNTFNYFRIISILEGLSYIFLVFIAMPLKYLFGLAIFVKISGMLHGLLFILFIIYLFKFFKKYKLNSDLKKDYFVYSLSPFAFILIESSLKELKWNKKTT